MSDSKEKDELKHATAALGNALVELAAKDITKVYTAITLDTAIAAEVAAIKQNVDLLTQNSITGMSKLSMLETEKKQFDDAIALYKKATKKG